jgi:hypothetical protein
MPSGVGTATKDVWSKSSAAVGGAATVPSSRAMPSGTDRSSPWGEAKKADEPSAGTAGMLAVWGPPLTSDGVPTACAGNAIVATRPEDMAMITPLRRTEPTYSPTTDNGPVSVESDDEVDLWDARWRPVARSVTVMNLSGRLRGELSGSGGRRVTRPSGVASTGSVWWTWACRCTSVRLHPKERARESMVGSRGRPEVVPPPLPCGV